MAFFPWTSEDIRYEKLSDSSCSQPNHLDFEMKEKEEEEEEIVGAAGELSRLDSYGLPLLPIQKSLGPYVIKLSHISKAYGISGRSEDDSVVALRDVHMDTDSEIYPIRKGEFVMLRGPSGGGKTSLLNILGTIDSPTKGQVEILENIIDAKVSLFLNFLCKI